LHCLACHGSRGKGDGPLLEQAREEGLDVTAPNFSHPEVLRERTDSDLLRYASSGVFHGKIPLEVNQHSWWHGPLNSEEEQALVLYLRTLAISGPR
jgi:hypothetical protein